MKKTFLITVLSLLVGLGFTSCNKVSLKGTWIQPSRDTTSSEAGFTLQKDGTFTPINMAFEYYAWEKNGDQLILKGKGDSDGAPVADTFWIDELTEEQLVLKDFWNNSLTYQRKEE